MLPADRPRRRRMTQQFKIKGGQGYMAIPRGKELSLSEPFGCGPYRRVLGTKLLTAAGRERIKRCVAHFLIGSDPDASQAEVTYSILDALSADHLAEPDVIVLDSSQARACNRRRGEKSSNSIKKDK
jgi:hypothetical protein